MTPFIRKEDAAGKLSWGAVADALEAGHRLPKARLRDVLVEGGRTTMLNRTAWIEGLGFAVKAVTVVPENAARGLPTVQGAVLVFGDLEGELEAVIDGVLVTDWKTASDSVLGARLLARPDSRRLLVVGAGTVAGNLVRAYSEVFPGLEEIALWNRTAARAQALAGELAAEGLSVTLAEDLAEAAGQADIVACATMARSPVLQGDWIRPGTHVDLVGAYKADMREADDALLAKARLFVDSRDTTIGHIGELMIPLASGVIVESDVLADLYELAAGRAGRRDPAEITLFKNGGGAHLDLMTAKAILRAVQEAGS
ncbi:ornithine cyclodeaminase [Tistlia consotensis]|uniref:Ornithine cyclodeaminase n=1 Tax=Tistlia consotensis USBA 355 TaxID=560819 RepID=A0A1Y6BEV4_9PROT|nr:ornithine cyclodeaminase [Tistlia consotensis]SME97845.1 ornithine cyclodeaminase [Tistlia consotensis USBA 355]SNR57210.1 ornithine cyclodeaminase [Tistlia consotensis]